MSKPASPSLNNVLVQPSHNRLNSGEHDDGRVNLSNSTNHIATYTNSQKASDGHEGELEQPLLNRSPNL